MVIAYEQRLNESFDTALLEGSMHFDQTNAVHRSLRRITSRLDEIGVPYAVAGGMALFFHGYRRFTEDVDILVTRQGLEIIHQKLEGLGWTTPFRGSKNLRDAGTGVRIEFLLTGDYPGDGKPKPVSFPDPTAAGVAIDAMRFIGLSKLIELKLASGTIISRLKDLGDVVELIKILALPEILADQLDPWVREKYLELWAGVHTSPSDP